MCLEMIKSVLYRVIFTLLVHIPKFRWVDIFCVFKIFHKIGGFIKAQLKTDFFNTKMRVCQQSFGLQNGAILNHFFGRFAYGFQGALG